MQCTDVRTLVPEAVKAATASGSVVTVGNFDGVHCGHRAIIEEVKAASARFGVPSVAVTFEPHPVTVFRGTPASELRLMTSDERAHYLREAGIDVVLTLPFTRAFAAISPTCFVADLLIGELNARHIRVGYDFNFGKGRSGTPEMLAEIARAHDVGVSVHEAVERDGQPISSTRVRAALRRGEIEEATALLGWPVAIRGVAASGHGRGKGMGIPTVNLYPTDILLPPHGVYVARLHMGERAWPAITNIGVRPTFADDERVSVETLVLVPFGEDTGGEAVSIELLSYVRGEQTFESPDALVAQIQRDLVVARDVHGLPEQP